MVIIAVRTALLSHIGVDDVTAGAAGDDYFRLSLCLNHYRSHHRLRGCFDPCSAYGHCSSTVTGLVVHPSSPGSLCWIFARIKT